MELRPPSAGRADRVSATRANGIDYFRSRPTDIWRAINFQRLNFTGVEAAPASERARLDFRYTGLHGAQDTLAAGFTKYTFNYPKHSASWLARASRAVLARTRLGVLERLARDPYAVWDIYAAQPAASTRSSSSPT